MKTILAVSFLLAVGLSPAASAQDFSVDGPGGSVPDRPIDCSPPEVNWGEQPDWLPFTSTVDLAAPVASITHVVLREFNHDSKYEVHAFLTAPDGARYNFIVRPGYDTSTSDTGDFVSGDYDIVPSGGTSSWDCCGNDISGGVYDQYLNPPAGGWPSGSSYPINNTPLDAIAGPAGTWSLTIYDWVSQGICIGPSPVLPPSFISGWTLQGQNFTASTPVTICEPGLNGTITCPCGNPPSGGARGCNNSAGTGGATLTSSGLASVSSDTLVFTTSGELPSSLSIVLQGKEEIPAGTSFGDGVRCIGENLKRLYIKNAVGGSISAPSGSDPSVSARSAALGDPILGGQERRYQVYYRDPVIFACPSPGGSRFNITSGLRVPWIL